ncbi:MAG: FixH family protein [Verrucomicrobiota bacterium]
MNTTARIQNPWPVAIIAFFALFISATLGLVIFTSFHRMELVSKDYYEQEIKYQDQIERLNRTQRIRSRVALSYDPVKQQITITMPPEHTRRHVEGRIHFYRPSAAGLDREVKLECGTDGLQVVNAANLRPGLWKVRVFWTAGQEEYFYDQMVVINQKCW